MEETKASYYFDDLTASIAGDLFSTAKYPWDVLKEKDKFLELEESEDLSDKNGGVVIEGKVRIGQGTKIAPGVVIEGPVIIGENALIRPHVWIRPGTIIGNECVIGHGVELKNSILFDKAKLGANVFVGDSIIGKGARIGSGVVTGNRRFDQKEVEIKINTERYPTGTDKFGCLVGDYARLGANCITSPGTLVGQHTWVYGGVLLNGMVPKKSLLKLRQDTEIVIKEDVLLNDKDKKGSR